MYSLYDKVEFSVEGQMRKGTITGKTYTPEPLYDITDTEGNIFQYVKQQKVNRTENA